MEQIKLAMINQKIDFLNKITGNPPTTYKKVDGKVKAQIGNYNGYMAYSAYGLQQIVSDGGGVETIISLGTKRELYNQLNAYINGYRANKEGI